MSAAILLGARVDGKERKHIPDFLLLTTTGPVVVEVKPHARLKRPKVRFTLSWERELIDQRGWRYEVWSEPPAAELENVRFLAGFRRERHFERALLSDVRMDVSGWAGDDPVRSSRAVARRRVGLRGVASVAELARDVPGRDGGTDHAVD